MVTISNVSISFDKQSVLENLSLEIKPGEFVAVVGASGSGKSTLLRLMYMDLIPQEGKVRIGEFSSVTIKQKEIPLLRRKLGIIFQDFKLLEDRSVYDNVAFSLYVTGTKSFDIRKKVSKVLALVGLSHKRYNMPHQLSGGEQQRVAIARALVNEPFLLLADEPTGNLDPATSLDILKLLMDINMKGMTVVLTTHNYDLIRKANGRVVQIKDHKASEVQFKT